MRRVFQFAAGILALSVALQPLAAATTCGMPSPASCPMGMTEMTSDCPMARQMADAGCIDECCNHAVPRTAAPAVAPAKPRVGTVSAGPAAVVPFAEAAIPRAAVGSPAFVSSSPPHYILNQVFRI